MKLYKCVQISNSILLHLFICVCQQKGFSQNFENWHHTTRQKSKIGLSLNGQQRDENWKIKHPGMVFLPLKNKNGIWNSAVCCFSTFFEYYLVVEITKYLKEFFKKVDFSLFFDTHNSNAIKSLLSIEYGISYLFSKIFFLYWGEKMCKNSFIPQIKSFDLIIL